MQPLPNPLLFLIYHLHLRPHTLHPSALVRLICVLGKWCLFVLRRMPWAGGKTIDPCWPHTQPYSCRSDSTRQMNHWIHCADWPIPNNITSERERENTSWNRPHKPEGFLLITSVHPLHSALSQSGSPEVYRINVKIQDRTECFSPAFSFFVYWTRILIPLKQWLEEAQRSKKCTMGLMP